jgi:exosortase A
MSAVPASLRLGSAWRTALPALLVLLAAIGLLYRETAVAMVGIWSRSDTFAHAFMVLPISLWLIWRQRQALAMLTPRPQPWMLLALLLAGAAWVLADLVVVNAAAQFAFVALLVLAVPAMLGLQVAFAILFPLLFLFFAVPFGEFLLPVLMEYTANFTIVALRLSGIPVYREGLQFVIPSGSWSVVEACSGVRYLIASFMIGTLFAYLNYRSTKRRLVFIGVSIVVPIVANWVRAYMIVMLGHLSGNTIAVGVDHLIYGWLFFGVVITIMFLIGARWSESQAAVSGAPQRLAVREWPGGSSGAFGGMLLACLAAVSLPPLLADAIQHPPSTAAAPALALPDRLGDWRADEGVASLQWRPRFLNPTVEAAQAYMRDNETVGVYIAYYRGQGPDRKLVSSRNVLVSSQDREWNHIASGRRPLELAAQSLTMRTAELLGPNVSGSVDRSRLTVWTTYWVNGRMVHSDAAAKWHTALALLKGRPDDAALIVFYAENEGRGAAGAVLEAFAKSNLDRVGVLLQETADKR